MIGRVASLQGPARERAKIALRTVLHRRNLDLVRHPYPVRVATTARHLGLCTVLDVGANVGQYGSAIRASGFDGRILSCEPLSDAFARLSARCAGDPNWTAERTAVGDAAGTVHINVSANSFSSSVLPILDAHTGAAPGSEFIGTEAVPATTVDELVARHGLDPARTLLKVDTQGYEGPVLDGAATTLPSFAAVQLELSLVPLYEGQLLFDDLTERLAKSGFLLYGLDAGFADPVTGRMLQCDGLFVRSDLVTGA